MIVSLAAVPGFSQNTESTTEKKEESKSQGLKKITNNANRNWNFDINIDEKELEATIEAAVENAKLASKDKNIAIALDIGPIGELIEPMGTLSFEEAYNIFQKL